MGGEPAGDLAARIAVEELTRTVTPERDPTGQLRMAMHRAANAIRHAAEPRAAGMGCTAALLMIDVDGRAALANVGDVRIYRIVDGYPGQVTEDHRMHPGAPVVTRCLGGRHGTAPEPYVGMFEIRPDERVFICTDGVHDALTAAEFRRNATLPRLRNASYELVRAANATGHGDNATVAVLEARQVTR